MRGFPPIQIVLLSLAFALLAIPLTRLTSDAFFASHREEHAEHGDDHDHDHDHGAHEGGPKVVKGGTDHPEGEHVHEEVPAVVRIRFAHQPLTVTVQQEGKDLVKLAKAEDLAESPVEVKAGIGVSHEGNEMTVTATWPEGTPDTALTLEIEPDGFETRSETRWSSGATLDEVVIFKW